MRTECLKIWKSEEGQTVFETSERKFYPFMGVDTDPQNADQFEKLNDMSELSYQNTTKNWEKLKEIFGFKVVWEKGE